MVPANESASNRLASQKAALQKALADMNKLFPRDELRNIAVQTNDAELFRALSMFNEAREIVRKKAMSVR